MISSPSKAILLSLCLSALGTNPSLLAALASDNASNAPYANGWQDGDNGGTGFGAWDITVDADAIIGQSSANGSGSNSGATDIDPGGTSSWGLLGNGAPTAEATRSLSLAVGETFSIGYDGGFTNNGGNATGFNLRSGTTEIFTLFQAGTNFYTFLTQNGGTGGGNTTHAFTDDGMVFTITLTSPTTYSALVTFFDDNTSQAFSGTSGTGTIDNLRLFNFSTNGDPAGNVYYNNLSIVPEPGSCGMLLGGVGMLTLLRRRRA